MNRMTKLEELKAAYEAAQTVEQWRARTISTDPHRSKVVTAGSLNWYKGEV